MWKLGLSAIVLGLLAMGVGGQPADAAERRCEFRFDHEKPAWIAEMQPHVRQRLAGILGQLWVIESQDRNPSANRSVRCGCYIDQVNWETVKSEYPAWYRTEPVASGKLAIEYRRLSEELLEAKSAFRRKHCL